MQDTASTTHPILEWINPRLDAGELFRVGADVAHWESGRAVRLEAVSVPDSQYRTALVEALSTVVEAWGESIELVLDFGYSVPAGPGDAMALCRSLKESGLVERIVVIQQPWMPAFLLSAVMRILSTSGMPFDVREVRP